MAAAYQMMVALPIALVAALPAAAQSQPDQPDAAERAQLAIVSGWAREPELVRAVVAQNAQRTSLEEIKAIDARWVAGEAEERVLALMGSSCAQRLKSLIAGDDAYREALVMDDQGALVCITARTSDYWQGDEPKWQRCFNGGEGQPFVDRARYDTSARGILVQISVPIKEGGRTIGALTVGIDRAKLAE
jgi:hypothetical protein